MAFRFTQITDIEIKGVQDQFQCRLDEGTAGAGELDQGSTSGSSTRMTRPRSSNRRIVLVIPPVVCTSDDDISPADRR